MRVEMPNENGAFGTLANAIGDAGGQVAAVDMRSVTRARVVRDVTINVSSDVIAAEVRRAVERLEGVRVDLGLGLDLPCAPRRQDSH